MTLAIQSIGPRNLDSSVLILKRGLGFVSSFFLDAPSYLLLPLSDKGPQMDHGAVLGSRVSDSHPARDYNAHSRIRKRERWGMWIFVCTYITISIITSEGEIPRGRRRERRYPGVGPSFSIQIIL